MSAGSVREFITLRQYWIQQKTHLNNLSNCKQVEKIRPLQTGRLAHTTQCPEHFMGSLHAAESEMSAQAIKRGVRMVCDRSAMNNLLSRLNADKAGG